MIDLFENSYKEEHSNNFSSEKSTDNEFDVDGGQLNQLTKHNKACRQV